MSTDVTGAPPLAPIPRSESGTRHAASRAFLEAGGLGHAPFVHPVPQPGCLGCPPVVCPECERINCPDLAAHRRERAGADIYAREVA